MPARSKSRSQVLVVCGLLVLVAACGRPRPEPDPPLNTLGSHATVGDVALHSVYVVAPRDSSYTRGETAHVRLTLVNRGQQQDALVKVTSERAGSTSLHWDRGCDGTAEKVDEIVVSAAGLVPQDPLSETGVPPASESNQTDVLHQPYFLTLTASTKIRRGTTVPITFTFRDAGTVTLETIVQSKHPSDLQPRYACLPGQGPPSTTIR